jgi:Flp pilus assembly protein TadD
VFVIALAVRLWHLSQLRASAVFPLLMGDAASYDAWAQRLAAGDWLGSEVFYQAPLYPYLLGLLYALFGHQPAAVLLFQAILGSGTCALVALAAHRLFGARTGVVAGCLLALYAPALFFDGIVQKTSLEAFCFAWLLFLITLPAERSRRVHYLWIGAALGCLAVTRENSLALVPVLAFWIWRRARPARGPLLALLLGIAAVLAPVGARNLVVGGELHLTTAQFGPNFFIGNNEEATGLYRPLRGGRGSAKFERADAVEMAEEAAGRKLSPAEVSGYWRVRALEWIVREPVKWLRLFGRKLLLVWNDVELMDTEDLYTHAEWSRPLRASSTVLRFGLIAPLGLLGIFMTWKRRPELLPLYWIGAIYALSVAIFFVLARYRYPLAILLTLFAGAALVEAKRWWQQSSRRQVATALVVVLVAVPVCAWPALDTDRMRAKTHANIAFDLAEERQVTEAIAEYETALELDPSLASAHSELGTLLASTGYRERALSHLQRAVRLDPTSAQAHNDLGMEYALSGRLSEALQEFREAVRADPRDARAHYNLGTALASTGSLGEARVALERSVELDPSNAMAHNNLGGLLASLGEYRGAAEQFRAALELQPGLQGAAQNLARAEALTRERE